MTMPMKLRLPVICAAGLFAVTLFSGCVTQQPKMTQTASGKPEVVIATTDVDAIKSAVISSLVNHGYTVEKDTPYELEMTRPTNSTENLAASLSIGNSYSTNSRVATYMFAKQNGSVRVIVHMFLRAQMPGAR